MAQTASNLEERQEFWKPVIPPRQEIAEGTESATASCGNCGTELIADARFCHVCGMDGHTATPEPVAAVHPWYDLSSVCEALGQTTASLIALVLGSVCVIAALFTGLLFTATTWLDWQAVQIWRIEWLLAAVALFVAGVLLKKK
jgi:zinc ribbon protein